MPKAIESELEKRVGKVPKSVIDDFTNKRYDKCLTTCNKILLKEPNNCIALMYVGTILQERDKHILAVQYFNQIIKFAPELYFAWGAKGMSELKLSRYSDAITSFFEEGKLTPSRAQPWSFLALSYYLNGRKKFAFKILNEVEPKVEPKSSIALVRGILKENDGKKNDALMSYISSQMLGSEEDKEVAARKIFNLLNKAKKK